MKDLKYEHQSIFPLWGRVKLNFRDRYRKPHIYSKNSSCYQFFSSNSQKMTLWCKKKKPLPTHMHLYSSYMVPHMIPWGIIIFQGVLNYNFPESTNKIQFLTKFPHLEKNCRFYEIPKIYAPKHFSHVGERQT